MNKFDFFEKMIYESLSLGNTFFDTERIIQYLKEEDKPYYIKQAKLYKSNIPELIKRLDAIIALEEK